MSPEQTPSPLLTRTDLRKGPVRLLRAGTSYKADLLLCRCGGQDVVLKDYSRKAGLWRHVVGVIGTALEARALRALAGVAGVPEFCGKPDRYCVAMTFVPGRPARGAAAELRGNEAFVRDLVRLVDEMHARGVVHLDLKHRSNLMVSEDGRPIIVDFESALCFRPGGAFGRLMVGLLGRLDRAAVLIWTRRLCPHLLSKRDRRRVRLHRLLRQWWLPRQILDGLLAIVASPRRGRARDDELDCQARR